MVVPHGLLADYLNSGRGKLQRVGEAWLYPDIRASYPEVFYRFEIDHLDSCWSDSLFISNNF